MRKHIRKFVTELDIIDSIIGAVGVAIILGIALMVEFFYGEAPCPLCLLQRAAFVSTGICLLMNVRYGNKVVHWALTTLSACAGIMVSSRQILLHVNEPIGFGSPMLGLHLYTWCFIGFAVTIIGSTVMLIIYPEKPSKIEQ